MRILRGREAGGVPHCRMPAFVTRGPEVSPARAAPGALGGAMGNSAERLRPPFNLAAGAGLAGPPGPRGLPGSVPALPAARSAAPPGHSPSPAPAAPGKPLCPLPTTAKCPLSRAPAVPTPHPRVSSRRTRQLPLRPPTPGPLLQAWEDPRLARACLLHSALPRPRGPTAPLFAAQKQDARAGALPDRPVRFARPRRPPRPRRMHNAPTHTATHTSNTAVQHTFNQDTRSTHTTSTHHRPHTLSTCTRGQQSHTPKQHVSRKCNVAHIPEQPTDTQPYKINISCTLYTQN